MVYLGDTPIAGTGSTSAEQRARAYTDAQLEAAKQTAANMTSNTPTGNFKENDIWFVTVD